MFDLPSIECESYAHQLDCTKSNIDMAYLILVHTSLGVYINKCDGMTSSSMCIAWYMTKNIKEVLSHVLSNKTQKILDLIVKQS